MMFHHKTVLGLVVASVALAPSAFVDATTSITVNEAVNTRQLIEALIGNGVNVNFDNANFTGDDRSSAIFTDTNSQPVFGFSSGIALSTGEVKTIVGPGSSAGDQGIRLNTDGDTDLDNLFFGGSNRTQDASILEFEFTCTEDLGFSFQYVFGSEEYNEFVDTPFNDVFAFFLNGVNIALLTDDQPVSINTVNCGRVDVDANGVPTSFNTFDLTGDDNYCQELFVDNTGGQADTQFDGFTKAMYTNASPPTGVNRLKIVIADTSDGSFDSAILLGKNSLKCVPPPTPNGGGGGQGDPHFKTWRGQHYDFHGECDLVLAQNKAFESGLGFDVHIRTQMRRDMAYISGAVLRIGSDVLEVESRGVYYLNGVENAELPSKFAGFEFLYTHPTNDQHVFEVYLGGRERIKIKTYKDFVSVLFEQAQREHFGDSSGLMGDFTYGVKLSRDGKSVMNVVNDFGQEWQVLDTEPTLFQEARFPQYPQKCTMPSAKATSMLRRRLSESSDDILAAEKACAHWGDEGKDDCVFDVLTTGDLEMASAGSY
jgi:hypothetical protein